MLCPSIKKCPKNLGLGRAEHWARGATLGPALKIRKHFELVWCIGIDFDGYWNEYGDGDGYWYENID